MHVKITSQSNWTGLEPSQSEEPSCLQGDGGRAQRSQVFRLIERQSHTNPGVTELNWPRTGAERALSHVA